MSLRKKVGQLMMIGFDGLKIDPDTEALLRDCHIGGVILFARNVESLDQIRRLTTKIRCIAKEPILIAADQEGGVVIRFLEATVFPGNMALGAIGDPKTAERVGSAIGEELSYLGINLNLAPVLDINNNPQNPGIGVRSFGDRPELVAKLGRAFIEGHQKWTWACAKHFPGKGDITLDSHLELPCVAHDKEHLFETELVPFREAIKAEVGAVMTAHVTFPTIDPTEGLPATLSKPVLTDLLKEELGFRGMVITDDLEMGAITKHFGVGEAAVRAVLAGADLILVCHTKKAQKEAYEALLGACESGRIPEERLEDALSRIARLKENKKSYPFVKWRGNYQLALDTSYKAITILKNKDLPLLENLHQVIVFFPQIAGLVQVEDVLNSETLGPYLCEYGIDYAQELYPLKPEELKIQKLVDKAKDKNAIIFCSYNAHLTPEQIDFAKALALLGKPLIVVALRNPYDYNALPEATSFLCTYSYRPLSLKALAAVLTARAEALGTIPVKVEV